MKEKGWKDEKGIEKEEGKEKEWEIEEEKRRVLGWERGKDDIGEIERIKKGMEKGDEKEEKKRWDRENDGKS